MSDKDDVRPTLTLPLRAVAISAVLVAVASLAALIVVVSVKGIDGLSTLALSLAILAFVVQLIVFIVQAAETNRQTGRNQELHAQMMSILAQLQERTKGTQKSVDRMNTRLLEAVISKAANEGIRIEETARSEEISESIELTHILAADPAGLDSEAWVPPADPTSRSPITYEMVEHYARGIQTEMYQVLKPEEFAEAARLIHEELTDENLDDILRLAVDLVTTTKHDSPLGPGLRTLRDPTSLIRWGIVVQSLNGLFFLTPLGRMVARALRPGSTALYGKLPTFEQVRSRLDRLRSAPSW